MKIGFIGLGSMAKAIIGGMLDNQIVKPEDIIGTAKTKETMEAVARLTAYGCGTRMKRWQKSLRCCFLP